MSSCFACCYDDNKKSMSVKNTSITIFLVSSLSSRVLVWSSLLHIGNIQHCHQKKQGTATDCSGCRKIHVHPRQRISTYWSNNAHFFKCYYKCSVKFSFTDKCWQLPLWFLLFSQSFLKCTCPTQEQRWLWCFGQFSKFFCQPEKFRSHLAMSSDDRFWPQNR